MKTKKLLMIAAIAVMAISAVSFFSTKAHAQSGAAATPQVRSTEAPESAQSATADTDTAQVQEQSGNQTETAGAAETSSVSSETSAEAPESSTDGKDAAPMGTPSISPDTALKTAQAFLNTSASGTPVLDDENGTLVYSIDLNGKDVKVDAASGAVLGTDEIGGSQVDFGN